MTEPPPHGDDDLVTNDDDDLVTKDAAYFKEVRAAVGRGAPTVLLGTSNRKLDRVVARLALTELNERFATAAGLLGSDEPATVQLDGVHVMAALADDWEENRQACVEVLCDYLRRPYEADPGDGASAKDRLDFQASREVRHTVIRVIAEHLKQGAVVSWQGLNFDFTGVVFDGGSFGHAEFSGGTVSFLNARFSDGTVNFGGAEFSGGLVSFVHARFSGGTVSFAGARFSGGAVPFIRAEFSGGTVSFQNAEFSGAVVRFDSAKFSGSAVSFSGAGFSGGTVDFSNPRDWSVSPAFDWTDTPPPSVKLP